jgi:membrane protein implicated in regulation of membrane protease activity
LNSFGLDPSLLWLIVGALCLAAEAFGVPGVGFLFAGLSAVVVGALVHFDLIGMDHYTVQVGVFFATSALLALVLWKKLKAWRTNPRAGAEFHNIVGDGATAGKGGLVKGRTGQASWSGTTMMAILADNVSVERVAEGELLEIVAVKGNKLIVAPMATSR